MLFFSLPPSQRRPRLPSDPKPVMPVTPVAGAMRINPIDGAEMVYVPAGEFLMGSTDAEIEAALTDASAHFTGVT